jgi:hypothetical protein
VGFAKEESVMNMFRFGICIVVLAMLAGCCCLKSTNVTSDIKLKPFKVKLEVSTNTRGDTVLDNKNDKTSNCTKFADTNELRKGCIVAEVDEIVDVEFKLSGSGGWQFAEFQICSTKDLSNKPDFDNCGLSAAQTAEWIVMTNTGSALPGTDGKVDISALGNNINKFQLLDLNLTEADYFYRVCVKNTNDTCDEGVNCVCTDPGGVNTGRR